MESGRFTGFFRNAPFDKPGVLRSFRGFRPPFIHDPPGCLAKVGGFGLSGGGTVGSGKSGAEIDRWGAGPAREFFIFFLRSWFFLKTKNRITARTALFPSASQSPQPGYPVHPQCTGKRQLQYQDRRTHLKMLLSDR